MKNIIIENDNFTRKNLVIGMTQCSVTGMTPPNDGFCDTSATFPGAVKSDENWLNDWTAFPVD